MRSVLLFKLSDSQSTATNCSYVGDWSCTRPLRPVHFKKGRANGMLPRMRLLLIVPDIVSSTSRPWNACGQPRQLSRAREPGTVARQNTWNELWGRQIVLAPMLYILRPTVYIPAQAGQQLVFLPILLHSGTNGGQQILLLPTQGRGFRVFPTHRFRVAV